MNPQELEQFGLTKGEAKVYLALLKIGKSRIGDIIKESGVSHSKIYDMLSRLEKKGLVGTVSVKNRKQFEAKSPNMLTNILNENEEKLNQQKTNLATLMPNLLRVSKNPETKQEAEILYGLRGIKTFTERSLEALKQGDTYYILGATKLSNDKLEAYYFDWQKRRVKKGIKAKILYNYSPDARSKLREKLPLTEVKYLQKDFGNKLVIIIAGDYVGTEIFSENPLCFSIKNREAANTYKAYFEMFWKQAK